MYIHTTKILRKEIISYLTEQNLNRNYRDFISTVGRGGVWKIYTFSNNSKLKNKKTCNRAFEMEIPRWSLEVESSIEVREALFIRCPPILEFHTFLALTD